jgi:hypothetical protein
VTTARPPDVPEATIRDEVWIAVATAFMGKQWDDAIFAAFRALEAALQSQIGSTKIGTPLAIEAFGPNGSPKITLSSDPKDQKGLQDLFAGALSFYKGMRSHGGRPEVPCQSRDYCLRVLSMVSSLWDLLDVDPAVIPAIVAMRTEAKGLLELYLG